MITIGKLINARCKPIAAAIEDQDAKEVQAVTNRKDMAGAKTISM